MSMLLQDLVVGVLVAACAVFGAWRLMSVRLRLRALAALGALPRVVPAKWLARLRQRTQFAGGCAGCAGAAAPGAPTPGAPSRNQTPGAPRR